MATHLPSPSPDTLAALRDRLDQVDTGVHRLLRERFEIVAEIGAAKGPGEPIVRPAREAAVIENRLSLHSGAMPREVLVHIWRVLMASASDVQRPYAVHVAGALDAARYLYGPLATIAHSSAAEAVAALAERPGDIAMIADDGSPWWQARGEAHAIGRFALSDGGAAVALGGSGIAAGTGPLALVVRDRPVEVPAGAIEADEDVIGRYHPFPLTIPVAQ